MEQKTKASRVLRSQHPKSTPKNKVFQELRQELECVRCRCRLLFAPLVGPT